MLKQIRQIHLYLGCLFAPLLIFFAFTGALQTFQLHESPKGSSYTPPSWIVNLAEVHKNQRTVHAQGVPPSVPFRVVVLLLAVGMIVTTIMGIYMAFKFTRTSPLVWLSLLLGITIPVLLLYL